MRFVPKRLKSRIRSGRRKALERILQREERRLADEYRGALTR
jgi:hypothetical protein